MAARNIDRFNRMINNLYTRVFERPETKHNTVFQNARQLRDRSIDASAILSYFVEVMDSGPISYVRMQDDHIPSVIEFTPRIYDIAAPSYLWDETNLNSFTRVASLIGGDLQDYAYAFNGNGGIWASTDAKFIGPSFTISALVKFTGTGTYPIFSYWNSVVGYEMKLVSKKLWLRSSLDAITASNGADLNDGLVHHVAVTRNAGNNVKWFVDGAEVASTAITNTGQFTSTAPRIGTNATPEHATATIDEVAVWNYALTPVQIARQYAALNIRSALQPTPAMRWYVAPTPRVYVDMTASGADQSTEPSAYGFSGTVSLTHPVAAAPNQFLDTTNGFIFVRLRPTWSNTAGALHPILSFSDADHTFELVYKATNVWALRRGNGVTIEEATVAATHAANQDVTIGAKWTGTTVQISLDGGNFSSSAANTAVGTAPTVLTLGYNGAQSLDGAIHWLVMGCRITEPDGKLDDPTVTDAHAVTFNSFKNEDPTWPRIPNELIPYVNLLWDGKTNAHTGTAIFGE